MQKVFISSTGLDLKEYREAADEVCRRLDLHAVMYEYFEAMSKGATEGSLEKLNDCDLYVGIFAHRYGYIEDGYDLSVTELEFDHAQKIGLDCLCFVIDPEHPWLPKHTDHENYPKLETFKKKINKLIRAKFTTTDNFQMHLTQALNPYASAPVLTPRFTLPAPVADFTGREEELARLLNEVKKGGATITGLRGRGGIGKTQLALMLAEKLKGDFPDAHLLIDLKGAAEQEPTSPEEALAQIIAAFHPEAKLPIELEQLRNLYLNALHDKEILLVLDNARDAKQVTPLLPPSGSITLITSRQHFALPGWHVEDLDALPLDKAIELVIQIAPDAAEYAEAIATTCTRLPLAIRLVASALAETPDLHPEDYLEELKEASKRAELIEASLNLSLRQMDEETQNHWRMLGVFPADFDQAAACAVWDIEEEQGREILSTLTRYSLLAYDKETRRYKLHDLMRDCAKTQLEEDEETAHTAGLRHSRYYMQILRQAQQEINRGNKGWQTGTALFDLERLNIEAGQSWAARRWKTHKSIAILCVIYAWQAIILDLRLPPQTHIHWLETSLAAARKIGDKTAEGDALGNLGILYKNLGQIEQAINFYQQQLEITIMTGDRRGEGQTLSNLGNAYASLGELKKAIEHLQRSLAIKSETSDQNGEGKILNNLGLAYADLGQLEKAIEYYQQNLAICRKIGDHRGEGQTLNNLGLAYANLGQLEKAIEFYQQDIAICRKIGDHRGEGQTLGNLGITYEALGQIEKAIEYYQQGLEIARETGDQQGEAKICWNLGQAYKDQKMLEQATPLIQAYVNYLKEIGHTETEKYASYLEELKQELENKK